MGVPAIQKKRIGAYILKQKLSGTKRYPLVMMLEPLFRCNLSCRGCGKIACPPDVLRRQLDVAQCARAAQECGAPVVSIAGGEPLLHPDMPRIVATLTAQKRFVYMCTNSLLVRERLHEFTPTPFLTVNIHLDGFKERHDHLVSRQGVFDTAVDAIRLLKQRGFRVTTNTTFYYGETPENTARFLDFLTSLDVEGMTVAPCFSYEQAADQDISLRRKTAQKLFAELLHLSKSRRWQFNHSSLYLDFLSGMQDYECTPWGNPTYNMFGWQRPCYLINDGYAASFAELMQTTPWERYGTGRDTRCRDCMMHCGFEPTAVDDMFTNPLKALRSHTRRNGLVHTAGLASLKQHFPSKSA